jgi:hypothetical protein
MSTAHAIGAVTKVLVSLVDQHLKAFKVSDVVGGDVSVSALSPKRVDVSHAADPNQLNLFLYLALPNHGGSGFDLPTRDAAGNRVKNTPLALDLYYLITAYGSANYFAEMILGHAMQALHENPILPRDAIRTKLEPSASPTNAETALAQSGIAEQMEHIKISPEKLNTEELSRLWSAIGAEYRPTAAYRATVVLIEMAASTKMPLPVLQRGIYVRTVQSPALDRLMSKATTSDTAAENQAILPGHILVLVGRSLKGDLTSVTIDGEKIDATDAFVSPERVDVPLPETLRAGPHTVQIVHEIAMGSPEVAHPGKTSNALTFLLRPEIVGAVTVASDELTVKLNPPVTATQRVRILLNEASPPSDRAARAYGFDAPMNNGIDVETEDETDIIAFAYRGVIAGSYLVRVQVDGAETVLETDTDGLFSGPQVVVP